LLFEINPSDVSSIRKAECPFWFWIAFLATLALGVFVVARLWPVA